MTQRIFSSLGVIKRPKWREFKGKDKKLFNTIQPELWAFVDWELQRQCVTGQGAISLEKVALGSWTWIRQCCHLERRHQGQSLLRSTVLMRMGHWETKLYAWLQVGKRKQKRRTCYVKPDKGAPGKPRHLPQRRRQKHSTAHKTEGKINRVWGGTREETSSDCLCNQFRRKGDQCAGFLFSLKCSPMFHVNLRCWTWGVRRTQLQAQGKEAAF